MAEYMYQTLHAAVFCSCIGGFLLIYYYLRVRYDSSQLVPLFALGLQQGACR